MQTLTHPNGCVTLQSRLLRDCDVTHAFTTRRGGISKPPFDSLNFGQPLGHAGDEPRNIVANIRLAKDALNLAAATLVAVRQVHGRDVHVVTPADVSQANDLAINTGSAITNDPMLRDQTIEADALICDIPGVLIAVRMADCVPILAATRDGRCVAAIHAGWRGLVAEVVPHAITTLCEIAGAHPRDIVAAVGPCIGLAAFEVGHEVADAFADVGLAAHVSRDHGAKPHIDLAAVAASQLRALGVVDIDLSGLCTVAEADLLYSHRRDNGATGRLAALIAVACEKM